MTKHDFKELIFQDENITPDIKLLKMRLVYLFEFEEYETMSKIKLWIDELYTKGT